MSRIYTQSIDLARNSCYCIRTNSHFDLFKFNMFILKKCLVEKVYLHTHLSKICLFWRRSHNFLKCHYRRHKGVHNTIFILIRLKYYRASRLHSGQEDVNIQSCYRLYGIVNKSQFLLKRLSYFTAYDIAIFYKRLI